VDKFTFDETVLADWQRDAVDAWFAGRRPDGSIRGTLEVFTGGGKTVMALAAAARLRRAEPDLKLAVVVPTEALARQWAGSLHRWLGLPASRIGLLGAGGSSTLTSCDALVCVLNSAAKKLPLLAEPAETQPLMLIVDECHRAGAPVFRRVFDTTSPFRMGLSATPDREELDENGEPLRWDDQVLGRELGDVVARFSLKDARDIGWLPDYTIHHHGIQLQPDERQQYERVTSRVNDLADQLESRGVATNQARQASTRGDDTATLAAAYVAAVATRKDLLYRASERQRVVVDLVRRLGDPEHPRKVLLFHERVAAAGALHEVLSELLPDRVTLEHSQLPTREREAALQRFRDGTRPILVSVKSLIEGIDVPDADVGISVASSSSVRQRVQSLGRVLRRSFDDDQPKQADMHVVYVADSVDEFIYAKEDWSDLTGVDANRYWVWPLDPEVGPTEQPGPPHTPLPTEEMEWERFGGELPDVPVPWGGIVPELEYSVDTRDTVRNALGTIIENAQGVGAMVAAVRGQSGGRFRVTPLHRLVILFKRTAEGTTPFLAGQLEEPFRALEMAPTDGFVDAAQLAPGDAYGGPGTDTGGRFKLRQKRGGVVERRTSQGAEFAITDDGSAHAAAAVRLLGAWRQLGLAGMPVSVNDLGHAWYVEGGQPRFLADVNPGLRFPSDLVEEQPTE
jgi:superfamily II DNA or RNA helicase